MVAIICVINQFECCILIGCYFYSTHLYNMLLRSGYGRSQDARITWTNTAEVWGSSKFIIKVTVKSGWFRGIQLCDDFIDTFNMKWMVKLLRIHILIMVWGKIQNLYLQESASWDNHDLHRKIDTFTVVLFCFPKIQKWIFNQMRNYLFISRVNISKLWFWSKIV